MVVFTSFFECGFEIPTGDFFRGLLHYYKIELVHLNPNSILDIAIFINLCEAFLGIPRLPLQYVVVSVSAETCKY